MLSIEEYVARRKREDKLNEFSLDDRMTNMKKCMDYVFEYFNQYLDETKMDEKTFLNSERLDKYIKTLSQYEPEVQDWLVSIYDQYDRQINRSIIPLLKKDDLFFVYHSDSEFRNLSYDCYAKLVKKNPFLKEQTEYLFLFIRDYHHVQSQSLDADAVLISEEISQWVDQTWKKYEVNLLIFASDWASWFFDNEDLWPAKHRVKTNEAWRKYDYDHKQKHNLFNLNSLYTRISAKPFMKGKKQLLEVLVMYYWLHQIVGDEENYWQEYLERYLSKE